MFDYDPKRLVTVKKLIATETELVRNNPNAGYYHDISECHFCPSWMEVYQLFCPSYYSILGIDTSSGITEEMLVKVNSNYNAKQLGKRLVLPRHMEMVRTSFEQRIAEGVIRDQEAQKYTNLVLSDSGGRNSS